MTSKTSTLPAAAHRAGDREYQRDARAWSKFSGLNYTTCLRLMRHPLAQGILGERISARHLIRVLSENPQLSEQVWDLDESGNEILTDERVTHLGDSGLWAAAELPFGSRDEEFLSVVLTAELLRAFSAAAEPASGAGSYQLKHTAEEFFSSHLGDYSYISNGQLIWAAAAVGLPLAESEPGQYAPNALLGLDVEQVRYAQSVRTGNPPRAHHHRPPGFEILSEALEGYRDTEEHPQRWTGSNLREMPTTPFHEWLVAQVDPAEDRGEFGTREQLAYDYGAGIRDGDHRVAVDGDDLLEILRSVPCNIKVYEEAERAAEQWRQFSAP